MAWVDKIRKAMPSTEDFGFVGGKLLAAWIIDEVTSDLSNLVDSLGRPLNVPVWPFAMVGVALAVSLIGFDEGIGVIRRVKSPFLQMTVTIFSLNLLMCWQYRFSLALFSSDAVLIRILFGVLMVVVDVVYIGLSSRLLIRRFRKWRKRRQRVF